MTTARETYSLRNGRLTVTDQEDRLLWQSPEEWWIDDFFLGDITNDGRQNLCLSVWKEGSYGPYRPFWVEANDSLVRNHLFLYQMEATEENTSEKPSLKAVWQSSHLARPNHRPLSPKLMETVRTIWWWCRGIMKTRRREKLPFGNGTAGGFPPASTKACGDAV
jgi:hypothetical protein